MPTKRDLLGSELMKELVGIRIDSAWAMLALRSTGRMPPVDAEKATGDLDDKGAIFVPGGFVFRDWEGNPIVRRRFRDRSPEAFRRYVRDAMRFDGATLLYEDGLADRVKLGNTAFSRIAAQILENKTEALRRSSGLGSRPARISSEAIGRSYCPTWLPAPYGARTSLSSDLSVCLTEPRLFYRQCESWYSLRDKEADRFWEGIRAARQPVWGEGGALLAQPHVVTCHSTRYREEILTGVTRISGFGRFGEFATLTLEQATSELLNEVGEAGRTQFHPDEIVAVHDGTQVAAVLRIYPRTNPGARLKKGVSAAIVSPARDCGLDLQAIAADSAQRYNLG